MKINMISFNKAQSEMLSDLYRNGTPQEKLTLMEEELSPYPSCSVCEKGLESTDKKIDFLTHAGPEAHFECFEHVGGLYLNLHKKIEINIAMWAVLNDQIDRADIITKTREAYIKGIKAVRTQCGQDIMSFHHTKGADALANLFNTAGVEAALQLPSKL